MIRDTEFFKLNFEKKYSTYNNGKPLFINGFPTNFHAETIVFFENQDYSDDFWVLESQVDTKETGRVWPQIKSIEKGFEIESDLFHKARFQKEVAQELEELASKRLPEFILHSKAKLTDIVSWDSLTIILNQKAIDVFLNFNLGSYVAIPILIKNNKVGHQKYYYIHLYNDFSEKIDFSKSIFYKTVGINIDWDSEFQIENLLELQALRKEYDKEWQQSNGQFYGGPPKIDIKPKKLFIDKADLQGINLFSIGKLGTMEFKYISVKLKEAIIDNKLTGFDLRRTKILHGKS